MDQKLLRYIEIMRDLCKEHIKHRKYIGKYDDEALNEACRKKVDNIETALYVLQKQGYIEYGDDFEKVIELSINEMELAEGDS